MSKTIITDEHPVTGAELEPRSRPEFNVESASSHEISARIIYALVGYYTILLALAIPLLIVLILRQDKVKPALLAMVGFVAAGAIVGSVLYQMRMLFRHYVTAGKFDSRWLGKYISAPWESVALALVVLSLLQGGGVLLGGEKFNVTEGNGFAMFGIGGLVGFGIREVVGWLGNLSRTMFPTESKAQ